MNLRKIKRFIVSSKMFSIEHLFVCLIVWLFIGILSAVSLNLSIFNPVKAVFKEFSMTDIYYTILRSGGDVTWSDDIVIVDMTRQHKRSDIAKTVDDIFQCKPKLLVCDLIFENEGDDLEGNVDLMNALNDSLPIVMACKLTDYDEKRTAFRSCVSSFFSNIGSYQEGYVNLLKGINNGCLREYTVSEKLDSNLVFSLPFLASCIYRNVQPIADETNVRNINYSNLEFPIVPFDSIGSFRSVVKDKVVILGANREEADMHITPVGKKSGVEVIAYSLHTSLSQYKISEMSTLTSFILSFLLCFLSAWVGDLILKHFPKMYLYWLEGYYLFISIVLIWLGFLLFVKFNYNMHLVWPFLGLALVEQARLHYKWLIAFGKSHPKIRWWNKLAKKSIYE